ncbi:MAG: LPS export ABC transporter permease LptG [Nitrospinota bacterium]|nr:LPS export ABC transporter permease LptG [Nitrospinota bacterium]
MTLLKRYILGQFIKTYLMTVGGLIGMFIIIDGFERLDEFVTKHGEVSDFLMYYLLKIPFILSYMAPQAVLVATVITLATLSRNNEFTAMKACGISVTGLTFPIISFSALLALGLVISNEFITPFTSQKMNYLFNIKVRGGEDQSKKSRDHLWIRSANGSIWNINSYDPVRSLMKGVSLYSLAPNQPDIQYRIDAESALWNGKQWEFYNGYIRFFKSGTIESTKYFEKQVFPVLEKPADFKKLQKRPEEMSARYMYQTIQKQEKEGLDSTRNWIDLHQKLSYPFVSVVLALIGIPLSIRSSRKGGLLFCVWVSLVTGFIFSFFYAMGISFGHKGVFSPILAAWGPCLLFICIGFYMLLTIDSEKLLPV